MDKEAELEKRFWKSLRNDRVAMLGLVGVAVILSGRISGRYDADALLGALSVLASAVLFAWNLIIQRQQAQLASPIEVAFFQHLVMLGVFILGAPSYAQIPIAQAIPLILLAATLAFTSLAALAWAYARAEAQRLIPGEYTAFVWAAIVGWIAFGEPLAWSTAAGALLIVAGCLIAARTKRSRSPSSPTVAARTAITSRAAIQARRAAVYSRRAR